MFNRDNSKKRSIWFSLALIVSVSTILCFAGFGIYTANEQAEFAETEVHTITKTIAENIAASVADDLLDQRYTNIEPLLLQLSKIGNVRELLVTDSKGTVVSRVVRGGIPTGTGKPDHSGLLTMAPANAALASASEYRYTKSIVLDKPLGTVLVISSMESLTQAKEHIYLDTVRATLIAVILNLSLLAFGLRGTAKGLLKATRFAGFLSTHKGAQLLFKTKVKEIDDLMAALNQMSRELALQHQQLMDNEVRKSAILEAALDCFITIDQAGLIVDFNPAAEQTFGYTAQEVRGKPMDEIIIPPAMRTAHKNGMQRYALTGKSKVMGQRIELSAIRRDGQEFPVELAIIPFKSGGKQYFSGYLRDITLKKHLEGENLWTTQLLSKMMQELEYQKFALDQHSIVSITDANGIITYVNNKFTEISGYSSEELIGSNHRLIKSGQHDAHFYADIWDNISKGEVWHGEIANRRKDGAIYWVASSIVPWLDQQGLPYQYVSIRTDITKQKAIESALEQSRQRELTTGFEIQRSLLWGSVPDLLSHSLIATYSEASQGVDGDFFSFTRYSDTCFELLVGDVMGKGVPAALIGAAVKNAYNQILVELLVNFTGQELLPSPAQIINALHYSLTPRLIALNSFVTLALYRFDVLAGSLSFVNAGHTPGLLLRAQDQMIDSIIGDNLPIGVLAEEIYVEKNIALGFDDMLLAYSDGITETRNASGQEFGDRRLCELFVKSRTAGLPPALSLQLLRQELSVFSGNKAFADDQTAVIIQLCRHLSMSSNPEKTGKDGLKMDLFELPWQLDQLAKLRTRIAQAAQATQGCLTGGLSERERDHLILASFESASNVIRHVLRTFHDQTLICRISQSAHKLEVELLYLGIAFTPPLVIKNNFSDDSEGGFGLFIIEQAVDQVIYSSPVAGVCAIRLIKNYGSKTGDVNV